MRRVLIVGGVDQPLEPRRIGGVCRGDPVPARRLRLEPDQAASTQTCHDLIIGAPLMAIATASNTFRPTASNCGMVGIPPRLQSSFG